MMLVVHLLGGIRVQNTCVQKSWARSTIAWPLFGSASAVIALSCLAALFSFIRRIAKWVSSGGDNFDRGSSLLLLSKELKYSLHPASRSLSLVGWVSSLITHQIWHAAWSKYVCQQLSQLPLRQHFQILCTSPLLGKMYHCTKKLWTCWKILSGTVLL